MNDDGLLKSTLGQLGDLAKQTGKSFAEEPSKMAKATARQVMPKPISPEAIEQEKVKEGSLDTAKAAEELRKQQNEDIVKAMYAPTEQKNVPQNNPQVQLAEKIAQEHPEKSSEEIQQYVQLQQQLHKETYYDPTFTPPKKEEPRAAEKVEQEKQQEMMELQEKEEKKPKPPISIDKSQNIEKHRGASG